MYPPSDRPMTPFRVILVLMLVMVAVLLVAGCNTSPGFQIIPQDKYVFVDHMILPNRTTIAGECKRSPSFDGPTYSFEAEKGVLHAILPPSSRINKSLIIVYAIREPRRQSNGLIYGGVGGWATLVYSLPYIASADLTVNSVTNDGTVSLFYQNLTIVLKPKDRWINTTRVIQTRLPEYDSTICTEEIILTDSLYNAGFLDKQKINPVNTR
jgi:hypothetical protein